MQWVLKARGTGVLSALIMGTATVTLAATLLTTVTRLRMHEVRDSLLANSEKSEDLRNLTLLSRVSLINQRAMAGGRESASAYKQEAESALIAIRQSRRQDREIPVLDRTTVPLLNGFNRLMGLPRLKVGKTPEQDLVLDLAFQFESYREYAKAARGYDVFIGEFKLTDDERDFALLHRGFCRAMLNQFDGALADFESVAVRKNSRNAEVASRLASFLKTLQARIRFIESVADPAKRGELYYNAAAYLKAIENFSRVDKNKQNDKIRFLTARALEETGNKDQAVAIYRQLVSTKGNSAFAVNANRRMYLLGTFLGNDASLARESKKNSETVVKDKEFMSTVTHLEKSATKLHEEAAKDEQAKSAEMASVQKLVLPEAPPVQPAAKQAEPEQKIPEVVNPPVKKSEPPAAPNLRNEKVAKQAEKLTEQKKQQLIKKQAQKIDKLTMADGNVFYGVIYKEDTQRVFLYSVLGNLELDKSNITKREKVEGNRALK